MNLWTVVLVAALLLLLGRVRSLGRGGFALTLSTAQRDDQAAAVDQFNSGVLEIRTGAPPGPNAADSGTLLASITLPADAFSGPSTGVLTKAGTWQDASADATGTAGHFRIKQSGDTGGASGATDERLEGTVTATGGGGDLTLDNTSIASGQAVTINSFTLTQPAS